MLAVYHLGKGGVNARSHRICNFALYMLVFFANSHAIPKEQASRSGYFMLLLYTRTYTSNIFFIMFEVI